jgi:hypothetical protein
MSKPVSTVFGPPSVIGGKGIFIFSAPNVSIANSIALALISCSLVIF